MPNIKLMESGLPVAPLKIGALESCRELGEKVLHCTIQEKHNGQEHRFTIIL